MTENAENTVATNASEQSTPTPPAPTPVPTPAQSVANDTPPLPGVDIADVAPAATESTTEPMEKVFRSKAWYQRNLNWQLSNGELAKQAGVSRQRIAQLRKELFPTGQFPPPPSNPEPLSPPDFSDITGNVKPAAESTPATEATPATVAPIVKSVDYRHLSAMLFDMSTGFMSKAFGEEWQPSSGEERDRVIDAIEMYARTKQLPDLPPGYVLLGVVAMYSMPRLMQPNTKSKLALAWNWCKVKFGKLFNRNKR